MADAYIAYEAVIPKWEGEYITLDKDDDGGLTVFGISYVHNPQWQGFKIIRETITQLDNDLKKVSEYIKSNPMIMCLIKSFYKERFEKLMLDKIESQKKANAIFQAHILLGSYAIVWAQIICVNTNTAKIDIDGIVGGQTINAINNCDEKTFVQSFVSMQECFLRHRANADASNKKFEIGWVSRARDFL